MQDKIRRTLILHLYTLNCESIAGKVFETEREKRVDEMELVTKYSIITDYRLFFLIQFIFSRK